MEGMNDISITELKEFLHEMGVGESKLAGLVEVAADHRLSLNEVGTILGIIIFYGVAWADGKIQKEERQFLNNVAQGASFRFSEKGRMLLKAFHEHVLEEGIDAQSVLAAIGSLKVFTVYEKDKREVNNCYLEER